MLQAQTENWFHQHKIKDDVSNRWIPTSRHNQYLKSL